MPTVVVSKKDVASVLIGEYLTENYFEKTDRFFGNYHVFRYGDVDLIIIESEHIYADWLQERYPSDLYIVASRHSAESGIPTLTVHTTGNWGDAMYGGKARTLSYAPADHMLSALKSLYKNRIDGYSVSYEVTHHGPTLDAPVMFVEIGSTEEQWRDEEAARVVGEAIIAALAPERAKAAIGVGGGHYAPRFTQIALKKDVAFGHMVPKYALEFADEYMLRQAVLRTKPQPEYYAVHGIDEETRGVVEEIAEEFDLQRIKWPSPLPYRRSL